jgi:hypothetical protein
MSSGVDGGLSSHRISSITMKRRQNDLLSARAFPMAVLSVSVCQLPRTHQLL